MRTKGATSCVPVKLSRLNKVFQPHAIIWVWRKQVESNGLSEAVDVPTKIKKSVKFKKANQR